MKTVQKMQNFKFLYARPAEFFWVEIFLTTSERAAILRYVR
jgi:hypothetical protein